MSKTTPNYKEKTMTTIKSEIAKYKIILNMLGHDSLDQWIPEWDVNGRCSVERCGNCGHGHPMSDTEILPVLTSLKEKYKTLNAFEEENK
jgi:hypothetical protein